MFDRAPRLSDNALLDLVQRQTFRYFWDFAHPISGLSRERNCSRTLDVVTSGGSGFGIMAILVAAERGWISRKDALARLMKMVGFLERAPTYHGVFPHWLDGASGQTVPFSPTDDGGDIVETSLLFMGLLCARQYFTGGGREAELRSQIDRLWLRVEWNWHAPNDGDVLLWHWSPSHRWSVNHGIRGWNECLITYLLAASSPTHSISPRPYHLGFAQYRQSNRRQTYHGIELPLGPSFGGPLFFAHYSFLGLDPRGLSDAYADYWQQNVAHTLINREHCLRNPLGHKGYGTGSWGLTASDNHLGYSAHAPDNDLGVVSPTAALSSMPYTPDHSMAALNHFFYTLGGRLWGEFGFHDAFCEHEDWVATSYLAINQGPIIVMIENFRSGLVWDLFMSCPEIRTGLAKLGFRSGRYPDAIAARTRPFSHIEVGLSLPLHAEPAMQE
jgi:hypothetical protein